MHRQAQEDRVHAAGSVWGQGAHLGLPVPGRGRRAAGQLRSGHAAHGAEPEAAADAAAADLGSTLFICLRAAAAVFIFT